MVAVGAAAAAAAVVGTVGVETIVVDEVAFAAGTAAAATATMAMMQKRMQKRPPVSPTAGAGWRGMVAVVVAGLVAPTWHPQVVVAAASTLAVAAGMVTARAAIPTRLPGRRTPRSACRQCRCFCRPAHCSHRTPVRRQGRWCQSRDCGMCHRAWSSHLVMVTHRAP